MRTTTNNLSLNGNAVSKLYESSFIAIQSFDVNLDLSFFKQLEVIKGERLGLKNYEATQELFQIVVSQLIIFHQLYVRSSVYIRYLETVDLSEDPVVEVTSKVFHNYRDKVTAAARALVFYKKGFEKANENIIESERMYGDLYRNSEIYKLNIEERDFYINKISKTLRKLDLDLKGENISLTAHRMLIL
uniref:Uncharacterized protein n=1 Tax=Sphaerobolus stellatus TaxID=68786 RepID=A0A7D4ZN43_9AGAM|nr:hypothetical protein [Sphaerobolus stellatus]